MFKEFNIGDKLSLKDIQVGMIIDLLPYNQIKDIPTFKDVEVISLQPPFGIGVMYKNSDWYINLLEDYCVCFKSSPSVSSTDNTSCLSKQSIEEAIKTLSQAAQELSTHVSVDGKGNVTVYSDYHQEDLVFNTAEKLLQYIACVKKLDSFKENN